MERAAFRFDGYKFTQIRLDLDKLGGDRHLDIRPSGVFDRDQREYRLAFDLYIRVRGEEAVYIKCLSLFKMGGEDIPDYFYANSIAIVFPYVRAFISTVSLQAGVTPAIILPTLNLSSLRDRLRDNTEIRSVFQLP